VGLGGNGWLLPSGVEGKAVELIIKDVEWTSAKNERVIAEVNYAENYWAYMLVRVFSKVECSASWGHNLMP
jgi:hypothetical protein